MIIDKTKVITVVNEILPKFPDMHGTIMIAIGDKILWHQGFSYHDAPISTNKHAQYLIASLTKQFTAVALLKALHDKNMHGVQDDLHKPIDTWLAYDHLIWNGDMPRWVNQVTLHHLLTHTSGIKNLQDQLEFEPGKQYAYSNIGYTLLGAVIQTITSESLDVYFKKVLFEPCGINDTFIPSSGKPIDLQKNFQRLALGFEREVTDKNIKYYDMSEKVNFDKPSASGGIISTTHDLVKWNHALYQGKVIPMFLVEMMTTRYIQKETYPYYDGFETLCYGYGIDIHEQQKYYQHCGGIAGYQSKISYNPATKITIVNLSNVVEENPPIFAFVNQLRNKFGDE